MFLIYILNTYQKINQDRMEQNIPCSVYQTGNGEIVSEYCSAKDIINTLKNRKDTVLSIGRFKGETIPELPDRIEVLSVGTSRMLKGFTKFPSNLVYLKIHTCPNLDVSSLPPYPPRFDTLEIVNSSLNRLPPLIDNLRELWLDNNRITQLPESWPSNLAMLSVANNQIRELRSFPPRLREADFTGNQIQIIPRIPETNPILQFDEENLEEPFRSYYTEYLEMPGGIIDEAACIFLRTKVNAYWDHIEEMKHRGRNTKALQLVTKNGAILRTNASGREQLIPNVASIIGSFLSGEKGSLPQQLQKVKTKHNNPPKGGKRKTRKRKIQKRKTRKN